jgi:hypothetical protein
MPHEQKARDRSVAVVESRRDYTMVVCRGLVAIVIIIFGWLVWPTPYRYTSMSYEGATFPIRIHRITGKAERLTPARGWLPTGPTPKEINR